MLIRTDKTVKCYMPDSERRILASSLNGPWNSIHVLSLNHEKQGNKQVNNVIRMLVDANSKVMFWMTVEDVEFKWEMFRLSVSSEKEIAEWCMRDGYFSWESPVVGLENLSSSLDISSFLNVRNQISLIGINGWYENDGQRFIETAESGLLVSNSYGRMLIYDSGDSPMCFCITTKKSVIDSVLNDATIIPLITT